VAESIGVHALARLVYAAEPADGWVRCSIGVQCPVVPHPHNHPLPGWPVPTEMSVCTGIAATWCPIHGDCTCPFAVAHPEDAGDYSRTWDEPTCPLHGQGSPHAEPDRPMIWRLCGDGFPSVGEMHGHLMLVHAGIDFDVDDVTD
jgi:hypothetical protein